DANQPHFWTLLMQIFEQIAIPATHVQHGGSRVVCANNSVELAKEPAIRVVEPVAMHLLKVLGTVFFLMNDSLRIGKAVVALRTSVQLRLGMTELQRTFRAAYGTRQALRSVFRRA